MENKPRLARPIDNWSWLAGAILILIGGAALLNLFVDLPINFAGIVTTILFGGGAVAFYAVYLRNHANWWALIPAYVLFTVGVLISAGMLGIRGNVLGIYIMLAIAFPFAYVYFHNREQWWALIPAYVMTAVAGIILFSGFLPGNGVGIFVMLAIALPFYYVYFRNRRHWWALIPAGIMSVIAFGIALASLQVFIPAALILAGIFLLARQVLPRGDSKPPQLPVSGPDADKPKSV